MVCTVALDALLWDIRPFGDRAADISWRGALQVMSMALATALLAAAMRAAADARRALTATTIDFWPGDHVRQTVAGLGLAAGVAFPLVLWVSPRVFHEWAMEDAWVEWLSAVLLLAGSVICADVVRRHWRAAGRFDAACAAVAVLALLLFVMAGEEVSWLQRVFGIATPGIFSGNAQGEMKLHNFATRWTEIGLYVGAGFVIPLLAPAWMALGLPRGPLDSLRPLAPDTTLMPLGAVIAAYNVNRWNWLPTQVVFWGAVALVILVAARSAGGSVIRQAAGLLLVVAAVQGVFLVAGPTSLRGWDVTEYKEFLIAAVLLLYCLQLRQAFKPDVSRRTAV